MPPPREGGMTVSVNMNVNDMGFGQSAFSARCPGVFGKTTGGMEPCMAEGVRGMRQTGGTCGCSGADTRPGTGTPPCGHGQSGIGSARPGRAAGGVRNESRPGCGCGGTRPDTRPGCGCDQGGGTPVRETRGCAVPAGQGGHNGGHGPAGSGGGCRLGCRHELLDEIRAVEFALCELVEYLDVYPDCGEALAMYRELVGKRDALVRKYEQEVGPLTCLGNMSCSSWDWIRGPFPWAYEAND